MSKHLHAIRFPALGKHLIAAFALVIGIAGPASGILINNGLAPPNPANVIDDGSYSGDSVYVRNAGCPPPGWSSETQPCPAPGDPTEVVLVDGGLVYRLLSDDSSNITMSGGTIGEDLIALGDSTITMTGGVGNVLGGTDFSSVTMIGGVVSHFYAHESATVTLIDGQVDGLLVGDHFSTVTMTGGSVDRLISNDSATVRLTGGTVGMRLEALESSTLTIVGTRFEVDGIPVPFGDLSALTGTLSGRLASGDLIDCVFNQGGGYYTGTIRLVPEPSTALLFGLALVGITMGRSKQGRS